MRFGSVCSGIEAASVAWEPLGWKAAWFAEIEPFPCAVLKHHYPDTPNRGDMNLWKEWPDAAIDVLCGGTPCQSFSVAGLRKGLDDPRGNLMLTFLAIAKRHRPRWLVWENVPGVLSSNGGRDFGSFLGGLAECGYGFAYRVLDAQYFGLAQRRKRVFVVAHLGDWRPAAAVLFERESLCGHPAPRREKGKVAPTIPARSLGGGGLGTDFDCDGGVIQAFGGNRTSGPIDVAPALNACGTASGRQDFETEAFITTHTLRGEGFDASEDGTGRGTPLVPVCFKENMSTPSFGIDQSQTLQALNFEAVAQPVGVFQDSEYGVQQYDSAGTLRAGRIPEHQMVMQTVAVRTANTSANGHGISAELAHTLDQAQGQAVAVALRGRDGGATAEMGDEVGNALRASSGGGDKAHVLAPTLTASNDPSRSPQSGEITAQVAAVTAAAMQVRRLTPVECERLQGFPDGYTAIPWRSKPADQCPDGPRYKALGNSWAVPVVRWIGERINLVDSVLQQQEVAA